MQRAAKEQRRLTGLSERLNVEGVALASSFCDRLDPLRYTMSSALGRSGAEYMQRTGRTHGSGIGDHHVAVHEDVGDGLVDASEDWWSHGDVGNKVTVKNSWGRQREGDRGQFESVGSPIHDIWMRVMVGMSSDWW